MYGTTKKKSLKYPELRCDFILFIEVRRRLEPYSKFSCMSVKNKTFPLDLSHESQRNTYFILSFASSNFSLVRSIDGSIERANPNKI